MLLCGLWKFLNNGIKVTFFIVAGYLKAHPRWGASVKVTLAAVLGFFLGKMSYQSKCAEMIMALPNSPLAEMLRQRKRGGFQET